ncbi:MAG: DUF2281 domain-containing protein [Candidatus Saganbacteria bacterium]|nr:DUF2281 domain-containing protein [Candidatus Saganbacteria bacterium]
MPQPNEVFKGKIVERIIDLPDYRLKEILDFIEFLRSKKEETEDPILNVAGCLSGKPLTAKEVEEDLYGNIRNDA